MDLANVLNFSSTQMGSLSMLLVMINGVIHLFFAGAIAKDVGKLFQLGIKPQLVSGHVWAFATLIGGVMTAFIYWLMHYSTLAKLPQSKGQAYENTRIS